MLSSPHRGGCMQPQMPVCKSGSGAPAATAARQHGPLAPSQDTVHIVAHATPIAGFTCSGNMRRTSTCRWSCSESNDVSESFNLRSRSSCGEHLDCPVWQCPTRRVHSHHTKQPHRWRASSKSAAAAASRLPGKLSRKTAIPGTSTSTIAALPSTSCMARA